MDVGEMQKKLSRWATEDTTKQFVDLYSLLCEEKTEADRMKHLQPVCTSCHRAKTEIDLKVLSRMR